MRADLGGTLPLWPGATDADPRPATAGKTIIVTRLYRSVAHNYFGHHQHPAGDAPTLRETRVQVVAGQGVVGDRFFGYKRGYRGQITFFAQETWTRLEAELGQQCDPGVFRRNVITQGVDLLALVGTEFEVQGVKFRGTEHCKPCYWMDQAFVPGTLARLAAWKAGGLRAEVLVDGWLEVTAGEEN